jgi:hypothetical protein
VYKLERLNMVPVVNPLDIKGGILSIRGVPILDDAVYDGASLYRLFKSVHPDPVPDP